jgi:RND family efflux transporter MFP subunit
LSAEIRQASIYAPFDGQVTQRLLDPGAYAGANTAILELSQTSTVYVVANVPDADLNAVARGKPITFETTSLPGRTFHGTIFDVNTTPTAGTLSYRVRILQSNPGLLLRPGMLVDETALSARHRNTLVVPLGAVFPTESGDQIYTVQGGKAKSVPVNVGLETGTLAEISGSGVRAGIPVITSQPNGLQDGAPVSVASPSAASGAPKPSAT